MERICEELNVKCVKVPASIATATATKSDYVDGSGVDEIDFIWSMASLASGKIMTIKVYAADDNSGTNATKIAEGSVTAPSDGLTGPVGCVSVKVAGDNRRYYCAELTHDSGSGIVCSCVAVARPIYYPDNEAALVLKV